MFMIKKKSIIIGLLVMLLIITGYLNLIYNKNANQVDNKKKGVDDPLTSNTIEGSVKVKDTEGNTGTEKSSQEVEGTNFFVDYRLEREKNRNKEIEYINTVINDQEVDADIEKEAHAQLLELASNMETETVIENLLKAKGFNEVIAIMHKNNINIIVEKQELTTEELAQILEIVKRESQFDTNNIVIFPRK